MSLAQALTAAVLPILHKLSASTAQAAWSFAYRDANVTLELCVGQTSRAVWGSRDCTPEDTFAWGSTTKPYTAVLALQLAERRLLDLDAPIAPLVDPLLAPDSLSGLFGGPADAITTRHLLQHRSGLREYDNKTVRYYQNTHPERDLDPFWVIRNVNRTLMFAPGTDGVYSSTGYTLAGLVFVAILGIAWDELDQAMALSGSGAPFSDTRFPLHGPCRNFSGAAGSDGATTVHGYQPDHKTSGLGEVDTFNISCTQGFTCGNMVNTPAEVALFFWMLLGTRGALLSDASLAQMMQWRDTSFGLPSHKPRTTFGYGLGLMAFETMNWGFQYNGTLVGHNGLTYGFGSQSGYHAELDFSVSWINNVEHWIGPDDQAGPNELYNAVVGVVQRFR